MNNSSFCSGKINLMYNFITSKLTLEGLKSYFGLIFLKKESDLKVNLDHRLNNRINSL